MTPATEKLKRCSKTHMRKYDVILVMDSSYKTINPEWNRLVEHCKKNNIPVTGHGIKASIVMDWFGIDYQQIIRAAEAEKITKSME